MLGIRSICFPWLEQDRAKLSAKLARRLVIHSQFAPPSWSNLVLRVLGVPRWDSELKEWLVRRLAEASGEHGEKRGAAAGHGSCAFLCGHKDRADLPPRSMLASRGSKHPCRGALVPVLRARAR